jgi:hypothetical protein
MDDVQELNMIDLKIPFFEISRDTLTKRYKINIHNHIGHDNEPRMAYYCSYIENHVLPHLSHDLDVTGIYPIELHDTYCFLDPDRVEFYEKQPALVFSKKMDDRTPILVPDPYMIANYGNKLAIQDNTDFSKKEPIVHFAGGTTGSMDPSKNLRLRLAEWSTQPQVRDKVSIGITNIVQMSPTAVVAAYGEDKAKQMMTSSMSQQDQYKYKYLLSIDGNTSGWDRPIWIANSKSLLLKYTSDQVLWNYPLLQEDHHYVGVDKDNMLDKYHFLQNNPSLCRWMITNANDFVRNYANGLAATLYMTRMFETISFNK